MTFGVVIPPSLSNYLGSLGPAGRHNLFSVAANALKILVRDHILDIAPAHHVWSGKLGAKATRHLTRGARRVTHAADADHGEVVIPITGISRAFHDVAITPSRAAALTIPLHGSAYGHRVAELQRMGWMIFRPKGKDVLMGYQKDMTLKNGQHEAVELYALKRRVLQRQDRTLLPSDAKIHSTVARAMVAELVRMQRKAGA